MDLILWRHADAEAGTPDLSRRLTPKGQKQAARMARWLERRLPETARILVSPAARAQQTAAALTRKFETVDEVGPGVSAAAILNAAGWPDAADTVVVVGHQPALGEVAALLLSGSEAYWSMRKGAVWWLTSRDRGAGAAVTLRAVIGPEFL
jgi:phosphohistidine phosphatase